VNSQDLQKALILNKISEVYVITIVWKSVCMFVKVIDRFEKDFVEVQTFCGTLDLGSRKKWRNFGIALDSPRNRRYPPISLQVETSRQAIDLSL